MTKRKRSESEDPNKLSNLFGSFLVSPLQRQKTDLYAEEEPAAEEKTIVVWNNPSSPRPSVNGLNGSQNQVCSGENTLPVSATLPLKPTPSS